MLWLSLVAAFIMVTSVTAWGCRKLHSLGAGLVLAGNVLVLSLVSLAAFARFSDGLALPVLRWVYLGYAIVLVFLGVAVWLRLVCDTSTGRRTADLSLKAGGKSSTGLNVLMPLLVALVLMQCLARLTPVFGWDALDWWALSAQRIISFDIESVGPENWSRLERWTDRVAFDRSLLPADVGAPTFYDGRYPQDHYHPIFFSYLLAIFSEGNDLLQMARTSLYELSALYLLAYYCMLAGVVGICFQSVRSSLISFCGIFSIPLLENHFLIIGYTEVLLSLTIMAWASCIFVGVAYDSRKFLLLGLIMSVLPVFLKNSGWGYALSAFAGTSLLFAKSESRTLIRLAQASCLGVIALLFYLLGNLELSSDFLLNFMGRQFSIENSSIRGVMNNLFHAIFNNSSFSVLFIMASFCLPLLANSAATRAARVLYVFFGFSLTFLFIIFLSQLAVPYIFEHSTSLNDTGLSRSLIPLVSVLTLVAAVGLSEIKTRSSFHAE